MIVAVIAAGILVANLVQKGAATATKGVGHKTFKVAGTMTLTDSSGGFSSGGTCSGSGGYSDISSGSQVTIKNSSGKTVAVGSLDGGTSFGDDQCSFTFVVDNVPDSDGKIYAIEVAHRGEINFNRSEADSVMLTLGDDD